MDWSEYTKLHIHDGSVILFPETEYYGGFKKLWYDTSKDLKEKFAKLISLKRVYLMRFTGVLR